MKHTPCPIDLSVMQTALKEHRQSIGKETQHFHFSNEVRLINFAVTGSTQGCYRKLPITREMARAIRRVVCMNIRLIKLHVQYQDRKKVCRDMFLKATSVTNQK